MTKLTMTRKEFAARVGIGLRTLDEMIRRREVSLVRLGGRVVFTEEHALELLERNTRRAIEPRRGLRVATK